MVLEAFCHCLGTGGREDFFERLMEQVAQNDIAVMVETARYETSVGKNAYLLQQCFAEDFPIFAVAFVLVFSLAYFIFVFSLAYFVLVSVFIFVLVIIPFLDVVFEVWPFEFPVKLQI